jgi:hypothetical protein
MSRHQGKLTQVKQQLFLLELVLGLVNLVPNVTERESGLTLGAVLTKEFVLPVMVLALGDLGKRLDFPLEPW